MMAEKAFLPEESKGLGDPKGRLKGKRILIIGGGQSTYGIEDEPIGNGRAMSITFAREGATVTVFDINEAAAIETAQVIKDEGNESFHLQGDASDEETMKSAIREAKKMMNGLDGIVLNVGIVSGRFLENTTSEEWDLAFGVNTRSHFLGCKYAIPELSEGGSIILISSIASKLASVEVPSYSASKAALKGICVHAAREGAEKNVRCNMISPGLIDTALGRFASKERPSRSETPIPLGRMGTAWEIANLATFLMSNEACYITGQNIVVDGGLLDIK